MEIIALCIDGSGMDIITTKKMDVTELAAIVVLVLVKLIRKTIQWKRIPRMKSQQPR